MVLALQSAPIPAIRDGLRAAGVAVEVSPGPDGWQAPGAPPLAVVRPADAAGVAAVLAMGRGEGFAVVPRGAGTQDGWGLPPSRPFVALDTRGLGGVVRYAPGDLTIRVGAGITLRQVDGLLRPHGQVLPLMPVGGPGATLGGVVAGDDGGPNRLAHGGPRDLTLGLHVLDGAGRAFVTGGNVVKNVSGLDIGKLLVGSFGTLGVLTEVSCKLRPRAARRAAWVGRWAQPAAAWPCAKEALSVAFQPMAAALVGAGWGAGAEAQASVVVVFEGSNAEVEDQLLRLTALAGGATATTVVGLDPGAWPGSDLDPVATGPGWDVVPAAFAPLRVEDAFGVRCEVPDAALEGLWGAVGGGMPQNSGGRALPESGGARLVAWLGLGTLWYVQRQLATAAMPAAVRGLRAAAEERGGRAVVARARGVAPGTIAPWGDAAGLLPWFRKIKAAFDPDGILSPGRFVGGL